MRERVQAWHVLSLFCGYAAVEFLNVWDTKIVYDVFQTISFFDRNVRCIYCSGLGICTNAK